MLKNYFRTAWRNLWHNKIFSFINILGLSVGISACLVIYLIVSYDFSFDRSHKDGDRIYRVVTEYVFSGEPVYNSGVPCPMPYAIRKDLAGLNLIVPFFTGNPEKVSIPGAGKDGLVIYKNQDHIVFADSNFFRMIGYEWLAGSASTSLSQPNTVVLTETNARLYFPALSQEAIIGRRIYFDDTVATTVTGIVKDLSYHSDFTFRTFISRATLENSSLRPSIWNIWGGTTSASQLFVKLAPGGTASSMERKITALYEKYNGRPHAGNSTNYRLQPLSDLHFNHHYGNFYGDDHLAHKPTLYSLLVIAALLLLLASINFINLSTARSVQRAKEIGIRKTIGGSRLQLIVQFLSETFVLTLLAVLLSILLTPLLLKVFADFIPKGVHFDIIGEPGILIFGALLLAGVSLLAGLYPAAVLSSYQPALILKNQLNKDSSLSRRAGLRKTLTVSQFVIAQVFIMGTLLVTKQISYSLHADLGFKKDAIVYFKTNYYDTTRSHRFTLMNKLKAMPGVANVSLSSDIPSSNSTTSSEMKYKDGKKEVSTDVELKYADTNFCRLYEIKLLAGHQPPYSDTVNGLVINETYMHILGFRNPQEAIAKRINWDDKMVSITGVVADFHQKSLHSPIKPLAICSNLDRERVVSVLLGPQNTGGKSLKTVIAGMQGAWSSLYPEDPFNYQFQDETLAKSYHGEQDTARLLAWATGLSIFISCLGLLGLVIYITSQRTKEIGIRKIMGASIAQLMILLSTDFLKLIAWAFLIAVPVAWWGAQTWLNNFAYRTDLSWWIFLAGGVLMGGIALVILLLRTLKAAAANPVESLRTE
jgi:ABC-type antimicrobial peptide transport system permease subunit